ncbi:MAG: 50S ribosomal protein L4 [Dysgonamonadaceae bacterium]|jgi:large subunit ribosomal protein L4|nr:50S ribosomal protein L4 [Dysgonamonadaceae bacterium]
MELNVYNIKGEVTDKKVTLNDSIYGIEPNEHVVWLAVKHYLANQRQGTHKTKERSEVSGSTRKLIRQKGSGMARRGDINSPVLVGGGRAFGPRPRKYGFKLNKKEKILARKSALSLKAKNNAIMVIEDFDFDEPKTKQFVELTKNLQLADKKLLFVLPSQNKNVYLSARNLSKVNIVTASDINTYKIMDCVNLVLTESAVGIIDDLLLKA